MRDPVQMERKHDGRAPERELQDLPEQATEPALDEQVKGGEYSSLNYYKMTCKPDGSARRPGTPDGMSA